MEGIEHRVIINLVRNPNFSVMENPEKWSKLCIKFRRLLSYKYKWEHVNINVYVSFHYIEIIQKLRLGT